MFGLLNLMALSGVSIGTVVSVLGYCLLPIVGLSGLSVVFSLTGVLGNILTGAAVLWCTLSASKVGQHNVLGVSKKFHSWEPKKLGISYSETTHLLGLKLWLQGVLVRALCCRCFRSSRGLVS